VAYGRFPVARRFLERKVKTKSLLNSSRATRFSGMNRSVFIHVTAFVPTRLIVGSLLFVALGCLTGSEASASCGDYVVSGNQVLSTGHGDMPMSGQPMSGQPMTAGEHHPTRPCSGPECSGKPLTPPSPVVLLLTERDFGWLAAVEIEFEYTRSFWGLCRKQSLPNPLVTDIFHPPRLVRA
jgi:hypothetical protein